MSCYKVKVFSLKTPAETEEEANKWLKANNLKDVQIIPSTSMAAIAVPMAGPSLGGRISSLQPAGAVQVQAISTFSITVVYQEEEVR